MQAADGHLGFAFNMFVPLFLLAIFHNRERRTLVSASFVDQPYRIGKDGAYPWLRRAYRIFSEGLGLFLAIHRSSGPGSFHWRHRQKPVAWQQPLWANALSWLYPVVTVSWRFFPLVEQTLSYSIFPRSRAPNYQASVSSLSGPGALSSPPEVFIQREETKALTDA